jgi:hypothetical protein
VPHVTETARVVTGMLISMHRQSFSDGFAGRTLSADMVVPLELLGRLRSSYGIPMRGRGGGIFAVGKLRVSVRQDLAYSNWLQRGSRGSRISKVLGH